MASLSSALRSFWHTMTSNDRHSDYDSPYRSGRHVPLANGNGRHSVLTSVTTATESRTDVNYAYRDDAFRTSSNLDLNAGIHSPYTPTTPNGAYSPGLRSQSAARTANGDGFETHGQAPGDVPMQAFENGAAPPPPVSHSWKKIDAWADEHYPELLDQLCEGATTNDLNDLEHQLDCTLPGDVRDSLSRHDGQERGGLPTGIIFSSMLLDCEEIVQEWENWRKVNLDILAEQPSPKVSATKRTLSGSGSSSGSSNQASSSRSPPPSAPQNSVWRQDLASRQDCCPPNAVQKVYAHASWIPLVRDWGGNNLAVDLAPGRAGKWGQVILFGRDYDTKYVVAPSWGAFMAMFADDLNSGKWFVDEDSNELKLREFKSSRVEPAYFDILRWRMDQKYGRGAAAAKRKSMALPTSAGSPQSRSPGASPYMTPADSLSDGRGRSMHRVSGHSPLASPSGPGFGKSSPLARVAEEPLHPTPLQTAVLPPAKLVEVETPRLTDEAAAPRLAALARADSSPPASTKGKEPMAQVVPAPAPISVKVNENVPETTDDTMKTIEI